MNDTLLDQLTTIGNLHAIAVDLRLRGEEVVTGSKLATIIELLFQEAQEITDDHCVEGK